MEKVRSRMKTELVTLGATEKLREAVRLELQRKIRHIPIVDGDGRLLGIVTDRDIKRALPSPLTGQLAREEYDAVLDETELQKVMTRDPVSVSPDTTLSEAVQIMFEKKIGGLPVVEKGKLVGIFTQTDALALCLELLKKAG
jgi:CBS domain-containing protein